MKRNIKKLIVSGLISLSLCGVVIPNVVSATVFANYNYDEIYKR